MMATRLYQNTARVHFNLHAEKDGRFGRRIIFGFFFFKQKTAYEISSRDWSSDVCSSDLISTRWLRLSPATMRLMVGGLTCSKSDRKSVV